MNVLQLYRAKGLQDKRVGSTNGDEYAGPCPGCHGDDRFHIWPEQNEGEGSWWCRQCGKAGDGIQFLKDFQGMNYRDACKELGRISGEKSLQSRRLSRNKTPEKIWQPLPIRDPEGVDTVLWREKAKEFARRTNKRLLADDRLLAWLKKQRGIERETVVRFEMGFNEKDYFRSREDWGLPTQRKNNGKKKMLWIPRGLVIPCMSGESIIRLRIRRPSKDLPESMKNKYYAVPGSNMAPMFIYGVHQAVVIVEAELDAILIAQEAGHLAAVLAMGTTGTKPDPVIDAALRNSLAVLNSMDYDAAGAKVWTWWREQYGQKIIRWPVPVGKDPGEAFTAGVNLNEWILSGLPPSFHLGFPPRGFEKTAEDSSDFCDDDCQIEEDLHPLEELYNLLAANSVRIINTRERLALRITNGKIAERDHDRLSKLVFLNSDVRNFIFEHPDEEITEKNLFNTGR